ncbi:MAG: outer membrane lipoprotein-sorting protein [Deltaproteobacteria bacterium]
MKKSTTITAVASVLLAAPVAFAALDRGEEIAKKVAAANLGYGDMTAHLEMILEDAEGQSSRRVMRVKSLERRAADQGDLSLVVFESPRDVKGMALLSHAGVLDGDEQWLYLPAAKRVRRIAGGNTSGPFVGSEFAYEDITGTEVGKYAWHYVAEGQCPGVAGKCFQLESRPKYDDSGYSRRVVWVDESAYRVHKIDFYDRRDALLKTLTYKNYKQHGKFWRAGEWEMKNHQSGKKTRLVFTDFSFGNGFEESDFHRSVLKRIR